MSSSQFPTAGQEPSASWECAGCASRPIRRRWLAGLAKSVLLLWLWPYLMAVIAGGAALDYSLKVRMGGPGKQPDTTFMGGLSHTDRGKSMLPELRANSPRVACQNKP